MKNLNANQIKIELEKIFNCSIYIEYYSGYTWFRTDSTQPDDRFVQIHFPEHQSDDDSFNLTDACFVLFDINIEPIDEIGY